MRAGEHGFVYVAVLAVVAVLGVGLAAIGPMWADQVQREREEDLLRIGKLYAQAIADYRKSSPGSVLFYPQALEDLLADRRFVGTRRYLRRLYRDPIEPDSPWGLVRAPDGGIQGVYSRSERQPMRRIPLDLDVTVLPEATRYADWRFVPRMDAP